MIGVLLAVVPLAMVDSLNPATLTMGACLTIVDRPVRALRANIVAVYITYYSIGILATLGPAAAIVRALSGNSGSAAQVAHLVEGLLLFAAGAYLWHRRKRTSGTPRPPPTIGRAGAALLGVLVTIADIPTAVPYLAAIAILASSHLAVSGKLIVLTVYCLIYTLPLQAVLAIQIVMGRAGRGLITALHQGVERWAPLALSALCVLLGVALTGDAVAMSVG